MVTIFLHSNHEVITHSAEENTLLSDFLKAHRYALEMPCGGQGRCGKCRVRAEGALSPLSAEEQKVLSASELAQGIRLGCRTYLLGECHVWLSDSETQQQICTDGSEGTFECNPMFNKLGAAVDIGTTTLAAHLYDQQGLLSTASAPNPQHIFGADVISRIDKALHGEARDLAACIRSGISLLLEELCRDAERSLKDLDALVITGNTAMLHLLTEEDVAPLSTAPFAVKERFGKTVLVGSLGLPCPPDTPVYLPRCISAFVGGDITTALMASGMCRQSEASLLADIGTNGELVLWKDGILSCCSTAAGPAFEGAALSYGMRGALGAIDHVWIENNALAFHVLGESEAIGICGSGVVDLLSCALQMGYMDETGFLKNGDICLGKRVSFQQNDVRQVQLAKGAVRSGMETLLYQHHIAHEDIKHFYIAGGFGSYLSLESAAEIGLIPRALIPKSACIGNAALSGAAMLLRGIQLQEESVRLADQAVSVELSTSTYFAEQYMEQMLFCS